MSHDYKLIFKVNDTGESVSLSGSFDNQTWETFILFSECAEELATTKYVQAGMSASLTVKWQQGSEIQFTTELPDWDAVIVFLHKFRPLGLQSESSNFYRVCNLLKREIEHPYFRAFIEQAHDVYSGKLLQSAYVVRVNDAVINSEKLLFDWLNSHEYHRDKVKRQLIEELQRVMPLDAAKAIFLGLLTEKAKAIFSLAAIIGVILGKQPSIEVAVTRVGNK